MITKTAPVVFQRDDSGIYGAKPAGFICGWATTPAVDSYNEVIEPKAFRESIARRGLFGPRGIKLLLNHDSRQVAGIIEELEYRGAGLWLAAQLNLDIGYVADVYRAAKGGGGLSFSVGFRGAAYQDAEDGTTHITRGDLMEVSVVTFPANEECGMTYIKARRAGAPAATIAEFEKSLIEQGLAKSRRQANAIVGAVKRCPLFAVKDSLPMRQADEGAPMRPPETGAPVRRAENQLPVRRRSAQEPMRPAQEKQPVAAQEQTAAQARLAAQQEELRQKLAAFFAKK